MTIFWWKNEKVIRRRGTNFRKYRIFVDIEFDWFDELLIFLSFKFDFSSMSDNSDYNVVASDGYLEIFFGIFDFTFIRKKLEKMKLFRFQSDTMGGNITEERRLDYKLQTRE